jgi:eukaryotic-like serine/threonine-protein kinase
MTERFTLLEKIGRGGMGVVWRARDEETGQIVALKLLHSAYSDDPDYVTRFERELELARRIKSPNVVGVLGFGVLDGTPYLALEYVDGPTLRQSLVKHGPYAWDETKALLAQIAQGLADAHAAGVVHRDVKPSNILMRPDGVAKIADFGIARGLDLTRVTGTSTLLGTPAYLPPEGPQDERSDLYSLGIVAYELLAGVPPFEGSTYAEVLMAHVRLAPDLDKLPPGARPIVGWLLDKDPKGRPQSAAELLAVLEGTKAVPAALVAPATIAGTTLIAAATPMAVPIMQLGPLPATASPAPGMPYAWAPTPPRSDRRRPLGMLGVALLVIALVAVGTAALAAGHPGNVSSDPTATASGAVASAFGNEVTQTPNETVSLDVEPSGSPAASAALARTAPPSPHSAGITQPPAPPVVTSSPAPPVVTQPPAPPVVTQPPAPPVVTQPPAPPVVTSSPAPPVITPSPAPPAPSPSPVALPPNDPTGVVTSAAGLNGQVAVYWQDNAGDFTGFLIVGAGPFSSASASPAAVPNAVYLQATVGPESRSYAMSVPVGMSECLGVVAFNASGESAIVMGGCDQAH